MADVWREALDRFGARFEGALVSDFGDPDAEQGAGLEGTIVAPLLDRSLISLHGEPTEGFLQTQLTCDVRDATESASILGAYCNPKGRVLSVFRLFRWNGRFVLVVRADAADATEKRLTLYRMRTPVTIERLDQLASIGLCGPDAAAALEAAGLPAPAAGAVETGGGGELAVLGLPSSGPPRFQLHLPAEEAVSAWESLARHATPAGTPVWRLQALRAGELDVPPALSESFTANMLNLYELGAVKFEKGCFPGQEVVARTHHLGKVPRRLQHAALPGNEAPAPGAKLRAERGEQARDAGVVVEAVPAGADRLELLAVVAQAQLDADAIRVGEDPGSAPLEDIRPVDRLG